MTPSQPESPHRRFNPLTGEWILVSPQRMQRPWKGLQEAPTQEPPLPYDPDCYLCPGNQRNSGKKNPEYTGPYVFNNDYPALRTTSHRGESTGRGLLQSEPVNGECHVVCFSPRHDLTLPELPSEDIRAVIDTWIGETATLGKRYPWVQVFENKGALMGCSNPHPHSQIWAQDCLPRIPALEDDHQRAYFLEHARSLLADYAALESEQGERVVVENQDWLAVVPYWAVWPFETLLLPRKHLKRLTDLRPQICDHLVDILKKLLSKYDNLFQLPFPYSMGWHGAPMDSENPEHWLLHAHFFPPLLRSAGVRKFMVGYEMLAESQRDLTAEAAAEHLRRQSDIHYHLV